MKSNKRQKSKVFISFIFNIVLMIAWLLFMMLYIYPNFMWVEAKKKETLDLYNNYNDIDKNWLGLDLFKIESEKIEKSSYANEIIKVISEDPEFFASNLTNSWFISYSKYLDEKSEQIWSYWKERSFREIIVDKILPSYTQGIVKDDEWFTTDFRFINYIESIIETFWLVNTWQIGIEKVTKVWEVLETEWNEKKSLETNIFYIPVKLNLKGSKSSILDFLHFVEKAWNISVNEVDDTINVYSDDTLYKDNVPLILSWDFFSRGYNIYFNQIIDVEEVFMEKYIDSHYKKREWEDLISFIDDTQWNNVYEMEVTLNFYVKWMPNYVFKELINSILAKYDMLKRESASKRNDKKLWLKRLEYIKTFNYLNDINNEIKDLRVKINDTENIEDVYIQVFKYWQIFENIENKLWLNSEEETE